MATLHVKDFPDDVYEALKVRARRAGRSLAEEVRRILASEATGHGSTSEVARAVEEIRQRYSLAPGRKGDLDRFLREDRKR